VFQELATSNPETELATRDAGTPLLSLYIATWKRLFGVVSTAPTFTDIDVTLSAEVPTV
jgi:hypothetical protein